MAPIGSWVPSMGYAFSALLRNVSHDAALAMRNKPQRVLLSMNGYLDGLGSLPVNKSHWTSFWTLGALMSDNHFSGEDFGGEGGMGLTRHQTNGLSFGGGMFYERRSMDTTHGGNQKLTLMGPGAFVVYAPKKTGLCMEIDAQYAFSENLDLLTWASWSYRFEDRSGSMSGRLIGLNEFSYSGGIIDKNWGGAGIKFNWRPWERFKVFSGISCGIDSRYSVAPDLALTLGNGWDL